MDAKVKYALYYVLLWIIICLLHTIVICLLVSGHKPEWFRVLGFFENTLFLATINDKLTNILLKKLLALKKPK